MQQQAVHHIRQSLGAHLIFSHVFGALNYKTIQSARVDLAASLKKAKIEDEYVRRLLLSFAEVLTNLVKHPHKKAAFVEASVFIRDSILMMDIRDDSSPFTQFDDQCRKSADRDAAVDCLCESGYGLKCIIAQHTNISYFVAEQSPDQLNHFIVSDGYPHYFEPRAHHKKKVFLVDDDSVAIQIQKRMLEDDFHVSCFSSARAALHAYRFIVPDVIVSDLNMPEMDGVALRKELSLLPFGQETPFIFLSGHSEHQFSEYLNHLGIDDFLCKPITQEKFISVINRLLHRSSQVRHVVQERADLNITNLLKPSLPVHWRGWNIFTYNKMADAGGGDFTIHHQNEDRVHIILADVMGHGMQSKFFSCAYAGYLRSIFQLKKDQTGAADILDSISSAVAQDSFLEQVLLTCLSFRLLPQGAFEISSAGHPPPFFMADGLCRMLDVAGPLPGLMGESTYSAQTLQFKPGDKIVLATDGFFDAFGKTSMVEQGEFLKKEMETMKDMGADAFSYRLWNLFLDRSVHSGKHADDATLIVMSYGEGL